MLGEFPKEAAESACQAFTAGRNLAFSGMARLWFNARAHESNASTYNDDF